MEAPICEYIKTGGGRCGSPAVHDQKYCYVHRRLRFHMPNTELFQELIGEIVPGVLPTIHNFDFPLLDDAAAVQIGFMQVVHGISHGRLNPRQARLVLSALHGAAGNLKFMNEAVAAGERNRCELKKPPATADAAGQPKKQVR